MKLNLYKMTVRVNDKVDVIMVEAENQVIAQYNLAIRFPFAQIITIYKMAGGQ